MKAVVRNREPEGSVNPWKVVGLFLGLAGVLTAIGVCLGGCHVYAANRFPEGFVEVGATGAELDPECAALDDSFVTWSTVAAVSGGISTGTSGAIGAVEAWGGPHSDDAVLGLSIGSGVTGALALAAGIVAGYYAERFGERCGP